MIDLYLYLSMYVSSFSVATSNYQRFILTRQCLWEFVATGDCQYGASTGASTLSGHQIVRFQETIKSTPHCQLFIVFCHMKIYEAYVSSTTPASYIYLSIWWKEVCRKRRYPKIQWFWLLCHHHCPSKIDTSGHAPFSDTPKYHIVG